MGMKLSTRCTDGPTALHTLSILGILRAHAVRAVPTDEILPILAVLAVQNPEILEAYYREYPQ